MQIPLVKPVSSFTQSRPYKVEDWRGGNNSLKQEFDYWIEDIAGQIPLDLSGTLFRNGPGLLDINGQALRHPFDGDGMICAIAFSQGKAYFRNRFVRTEGYLAEQAAGHILYRGVFGTQKPGGWFANAFDLRRKNVANTQVIYWGGKLLALWEAAKPYRLDPHTLETLGIETLDGVLQEDDSSFAAHPMVDQGGDGRETRLVNFSIKPGLSTTIYIYELDLTGQVVQRQAHTVPGFAFIHDFAITPNYYLFFQNPVFLNPLPYVFGLRGAAECLKFQANQPTKIWVIPRDGSKMQVLETDACFVFHHANAFEQGEELIVDSICYENFPVVDHKLDYRQIDFATLPPGQLWRFSLNLQAGTAKRQLSDPRCVEFPYIHPSRIGQPYRCTFLAAAHQAEGNAPLQAILKFDLESGNQELWSAAPRGFVGEPIFVPRPGGTQEDDGWVLTLVYDAAYQRTDVVILDARSLETGPVARLHLKHHIPYGLHGSFTPEWFGPT